jgi:REP element-mobilizing transposase RayT
MHFVPTTKFRRGKLPHWEVESGRYFVTVRLADSLPAYTVLQLQEIHASLQRIEPRSEQFAALQRQYFRTMEKYLDAGAGSCLLRHSNNANLVVTALQSLSEWNVEVPHYTIMPNHWHALLVPKDAARTLAAIMKRVKGRSAFAIRRDAGDRGAIWQREWFDRWMRDDAEWDKTARYIRENPVKAGLVKQWGDHPWTR